MKHLLLALALSISVGCTPAYQTSGFEGEYAQSQLADNAFQVSYRGIEPTPPSQDIDLCLLRCAELADQNGFSYFVVVDDEQLDLANNADPSSILDNLKPGMSFPMADPSSQNSILCFKMRPDGPGTVYESKSVMKSIRKKYGIKEE
jgi:hypothetical protein